MFKKWLLKWLKTELYEEFVRGYARGYEQAEYDCAHPEEPSVHGINVAFEEMRREEGARCQSK